MLVVAATERELALLEGLDTFCCGIGPVEAALQTARVLEERKPDFVVQAGIAGSRTLEPPALVLGSETVYCDVIDPGSSYPRIEHTRQDVRCSSVRAPHCPRRTSCRSPPAARSAREPTTTSRRWRASACFEPASSPACRRSSCARSPTHRMRPTARTGVSTTRSPLSPRRCNDSLSPARASEATPVGPLDQLLRQFPAFAASFADHDGIDLFRVRIGLPAMAGRHAADARHSDSTSSRNSALPWRVGAP